MTSLLEMMTLKEYNCVIITTKQVHNKNSYCVNNLDMPKFLIF